MKIRDLFRRKKNNNYNYYNNYNNYNNNYQDNNIQDIPDCVLSYSSGINAKVSFRDLQNIVLDDNTSKLVQNVYVHYDLPNGTFNGKHLCMEPIFDNDGNNITKESYLQILNNNMPLIKGFFAKDEIEKQPTNYIGGINYHQNGKPYRGKDFNFERSYKNHLDREMALRKRQEEARENAALQERLSKLTVNYDYYQPEDLSNVTIPYGNRYKNMDDNVR